MNTPLYQAIQQVAYLVRTCGMSLHDACRAAAWNHGVGADELYRIMTD